MSDSRPFEFSPKAPLSCSDLVELAEVFNCSVDSIPTLIVGDSFLMKMSDGLRENFRPLSEAEFWALLKR